MAACAAPPWPSQQRRAGSSERHSAIARMRERRAGRHSDLEDPPPKPPAVPRPPPQPRPRSGAPVATSSPRGAPGGGGLGTGLGCDASASQSQPWAPAWDPMSPAQRRPAAACAGNANVDDADEPAPAPRCPAMPRDGPRRPSSRGGSCGTRSMGSSGGSFTAATTTPRGQGDNLQGDDMRTSRVRGPAEARAQRGEAADDVPSGAIGADFKTLQQMIARGIQEAESGASKFEVDDCLEDEQELRRHLEEQRKRREEEAAARQREREMQRQKRRQQDEEQMRRRAEELDQQDKEELLQREAAQRQEEQRRREVKAAVRIQARIRGRRSRAGKGVSVLWVRKRPGGAKEKAPAFLV
eukprot:TRINITY_DN15294_c0_g1_i1.p1 TRINITY_DN15294_c0_g1~~TRINITY_DN15294_c0_g1_i1.p1  ORF type:complete len:355 (-),score=78.48 TRINITY_DN15294_c0_g1_i1:227-1291(-)